VIFACSRTDARKFMTENRTRINCLRIVACEIIRMERLRLLRLQNVTGLSHGGVNLHDQKMREQYRYILLYIIQYTEYAFLLNSLANLPTRRMADTTSNPNRNPTTAHNSDCEHSTKYSHVFYVFIRDMLLHRLCDCVIVTLPCIIYTLKCKQV